MLQFYRVVTDTGHFGVAALEEGTLQELYDVVDRAVCKLPDCTQSYSIDPAGIMLTPWAITRLGSWELGHLACGQGTVVWQQ